jgi:hypothetical protein
MVLGFVNITDQKIYVESVGGLNYVNIIGEKLYVKNVEVHVFVSMGKTSIIV